MHTYRRSLLCLPVALGALVVAASVPAGASAAAPRHVSPTGSGSDCTAAKPCGFRQALDQSGSGDEVIVAPGDYPLTLSSLHLDSGVTVHGVPGEPRPRLLFHSMPTPALQVRASCSNRSACAGARRTAGPRS
jgi:hypothetical protein